MQFYLLKEWLKLVFELAKSYLVAKFGPRTDFATYVDRLRKYMKNLKHYISIVKDKLKFVWKYVSSFFVAVFGPTLTLDAYLDRLNNCKDCKWNKQKTTRNYCAECFCPQTKFFYFSELKFKASLKNAKCPRNKWGN